MTTLEPIMVCIMEADDDGSEQQVMEIAEAFQQAKKSRKGPKRSILFLHVTEEHASLSQNIFRESSI